MKAARRPRCANAARIRRLVGLAMFLVWPGRLAADVHITETTTAKIGDRTVQGVRSTYIKGVQMRIEVVQANASTVTLYDLQAATIIELNARKKQAEIRDSNVRSAELERKYPRQRVSVTLTSTGAAKELVGTACDEYVFTVKVPMTKDGEPAMSMTGSAWIATSAQGADDYHNFAKAAAKQQLVLGYTSDNKILLAITRGQTELYRALAELPGIPYVVDTTIKFDGHGALTALLNKVGSGTRTSTVTEVAIDPLADSNFVVPQGWKHEKR
jgi:hypothetical protein